jgi:hypothetical protein
VLVAGLLLAPQRLLMAPAETPRAMMMITLNGGGTGPSSGGLTYWRTSGPVRRRGDQA